ncbi:MAG: opacity protein-like surface antigen [Paraglaciecola sp.]|jgi:opacity protein-like surface antigen
MKIKYLLLVTALSASFSTLAASPNWDFVELGYASVDIDDISEVSPAGISLGASKLLGENIFLVGSYSKLSDDYQGVDLDLDQSSLGVGYRYGVTDSTDLYAVVSYEYLKAKASSGGSSVDEDDSGAGLTAGVRSRLSSSFEVDASIAYIDIGDDSETTFGVGVNYYFTEHFAAGVSYTSSDALNTIGASLRYAF